MKKYAVFCIVVMLISTFVLGQDKDIDQMSIGVGGTFAKPKIIPNLKKLAIPQITINYRLTTTARAVTNAKKSGVIAGAKVKAYLEMTDGELTEADFQEISDNFYNYFQHKLAEAGIDTVAWSKIAASDFYQSSKEKVSEKKEGAENVWITNNAHNGNTIYGGNIGFAFGKQKKASKFCEEVGAPAGFFYITLDFADVLVGLDVATETEGLYRIPKSRTFKYDASVKVHMKVIPYQNQFSLFWNEKTQSESLFLKGPLSSTETSYHESITQDPTRLKNNLFRFAKEMVPVVIETTRAKYKAAAKHALQQYADTFVAKTKSPGN